ncbi:neuropeptide FF receptor 2 [Biomphalaria pfeifferi]|uniref:Neuropeptide FF receptor 2 n=1 Tax=Biomphalaria pfeifferi TaxID=112525 RepID=A0AAD8B3A5_BIOPF|nr:neuropeptide FF receptor 2 [Biomphalaria pfeifferi]
MVNYTSLSTNGQLSLLAGSSTGIDILTQVDIVLNCFLIHLLSLLGIVTNILNIIVLSKHSFQETTNILLLSLSVCDLLCSLFQPVRKVHCIAERFHPVFGLTLKSFTTVYFFLLPDIFVSVSILHTAVISAERLVAVCFPLHVSRIFTPCRVKWTILFIYVFSIGLLSPALFISEFTWVYDNSYNTTRGSVAMSRFYADHFRVLNEYASGVTPHLFISGPVMLILSCSVVTGLKLIFGRRRVLATMTTSATSKQTKDMKVVRMLLTVCAVNGAVAAPTVAIHLFLLYSNLLMLSTGLLTYVLRSLTIVIYQLIVTINFVFYVTMSSKFAKTLNKIFCVTQGKTIRIRQVG